MKKNLFLFGILSFLIVCWFQMSESNNNNNNSKENKKNIKDFKYFVDKFKLPLTVSAIVLIALEQDSENLGISFNKNAPEIFLTQPNF